MITTNMAERKRITRSFKMRGLSIQAPALNSILNVLKNEPPTSKDDTLFAIIDEIKEKMTTVGGGGMNQCVVTTDLLEDVVADMSRGAKDVTEEAVQLLDAFKTPRLEYDSMRKVFSLVEGGKSVCGEAVDKVRCVVFHIMLVVFHIW